MSQELTIHERTVGSVTVAEIAGSLSGSAASAKLKSHTRGLFESGCRKLVLVLRDVSFMDSMGVGVLVSALTTFRNDDGQIVLADVSEQVRMLLELVRLNRIVSMYAATEDAVSALTLE